jgi:hypothetical protein
MEAASIPQRLETANPGINRSRSSSKQRTFRLSSIPIEVQQDQLRESLETLTGYTDYSGQNVKALSLTRKSRNWQVCTVSFMREPPEFGICIPNHRLELSISIAGNEVDLAIDVDFYGIVSARVSNMWSVTYYLLPDATLLSSQPKGCCRVSRFPFLTM